jgi:hypothetical protein
MMVSIRRRGTALAGRLRAMSSEELTWRLRTEIRTRVDQAATRVRTPSWRREDIRHALAVDTLPVELQQAIEDGDWSAAHRLLHAVLRARPSRFVLNPARAQDVRREVHARWPEAQADAVRRADGIVDGRFDLLGYRGLTFSPPAVARDETTPGIDWHFDPVHQRRMPMAFWSRVPYLDPQCGDHKIVWELNRQQHWLALSRALWLTGDRRYARAMVCDFTAWIAANPPLLGANWASMLELAFRSLSWLWGLHSILGMPDDGTDEGPWLVDLMVALDRQLTQVERNLSLYFSPNTHLTGEALALYVCGAALPELAASTQWIDTGRSVLLKEIDRQIEPDGGHAERSTHYHRYTVDFYLLALLTARRIGDTEAEARFEEALQRLVPFARAMADGEGRLPRIGDDDAGRLWPITDRDAADIRDSLALAAAALDRRDWAPWGATEEVLWLTSNDRRAFDRALAPGADDRRIRERRTLAFRAATHPGTHPGRSSLLTFPNAERRRVVAERRGRVGDRRGTGPGAVARRVTQVFPDTGYVTSATESGDHLVLDAGPHGYLNGGHAHADALSVVLTLGRRPLLVDPGTPTYTMDPALRDESRSSISHNTVTVDGVSSAVPRGPFHWRTRADARLEVVRHNAHIALIEATHDGYGPAGHRRTVLATDHGYLFVDSISGEGEHRAEQHWHFDPRWQVGCESARRLKLVHESGDIAWLLHDRGDLTLVNADETSPLGWVSPSYGVRVPAWSARVTHGDVTPFTLTSWCGATTDGAVPSLERLPCEHDAGAASVAVLVRCGSSEWLSVVRPGDALSRHSRSATAGGIETDARALQRTVDHGLLSSVCFADGSFVRIADDLTVQVDDVVPDLHVALAGNRLELSSSAPPARVRLTGALLQQVTLVAGNGHTIGRLETPHDSIVLTAPDWSLAVTGVDFEDQHDVRYRRFR